MLVTYRLTDITVKSQIKWRGWNSRGRWKNSEKLISGDGRGWNCREGQWNFYWIFLGNKQVFSVRKRT